MHLDNTLATISVYTPDLDAARFFTARLIRQTMTAQLLDHDAVYGHAAAFVHTGHGVLIAGPKGTGKTTTLLSALRLVGGDFVTNDRLLLRRSPGGIGTVGYAWPTHLRATASTLHAVPGMSRFLPDQQRHTPSSSSAPAVKIAIEPRALHTVLPGTRIRGDMTPTLMLWPYRSARECPPEPVPVSEVRDILARTQFFMHDPNTNTTSRRNHWLLPIDHDQATAALAVVADQIARTVPCHRLPVTNSPAAIAAHVAAVLDRTATPSAGSGDR